MLSLILREGDSIRIGDDIKIILVDFRPGGVRWGIVAPDSVRVVCAKTENKEQQSEQQQPRKILSLRHKPGHKAR